MGQLASLRTGESAEEESERGGTDLLLNEATELLAEAGVLGQGPVDELLERLDARRKLDLVLLRCCDGGGSRR